MSQLWLETPGEEQSRWAVWQLAEDAYWLLAGGLPCAVHDDGREKRLAGSGMLVRRDLGPEAQWLLLATIGSAIHVNGAPLFVGSKVLRDRDEIVLADRQSGQRRRCFFSTERLARVEPFPQTPEASRCPRCQQPIETGTQVVRCPGCGVYHHQFSRLPCWLYGPRCALCDQATDLNLGYRWTPDEL